MKKQNKEKTDGPDARGCAIRSFYSYGSEGDQQLFCTADGTQWHEKNLMDGMRKDIVVMIKKYLHISAK